MLFAIKFLENMNSSAITHQKAISNEIFSLARLNLEGSTKTLPNLSRDPKHVATPKQGLTE